jgi:hypothetical protein
VKKPSNTRLVERYKPRPKAFVITDTLVVRVHQKMQEGPLLDGEILDMAYGHGKRPESRSAPAETIRQISKRYEELYGVRLMSTTARRPESYSGELKKRRGYTD